MDGWIRIYPGFNALYYSFYLEGLARLPGRYRLRFSRRGFPPFGHHGLALELCGPPVRRVFISASDGPELNPRGLAWCDVYAKVNLDPAAVPADAASRCLAIGPSFPVRVYRAPTALARAVLHFFLVRGRVERPREHFANYYRQFRYRWPEDRYQPASCDPGKVFFAARLWQREAETNRFRANFIEAVRSLPGVDFEGGFVRRATGAVPGYERYTVDRTRYPTEEYFAKLKRSAVAFNTPAVASCHGWKLAEALALGKATISTPLSRALPAPLRHGSELHFVDGSVGEIRSALKKIITDPDYRRRLETSARAYYLKHLSPQRVMERILDAARRGEPEAS